MTRSGGKRAKKRSRKALPPTILVFGESLNDIKALTELVQAIHPECPRPQARRQPLVLVKGRKEAEQRKAAADIAAVVRADETRWNVRLVVAHEDADEVEPAHVKVAEDIEKVLEAEDITAVAAVPAWEIEAWWYLWPEAVLAVNRRWRHPNRKGAEVGTLVDAKEQLTRDLRPKDKRKPKTRDYEEGDSVEIAKAVRDLEIVDSPHAVSRSFSRFSTGVRTVLSNSD